jgi:Uma2 family endonuclease
MAATAATKFVPVEVYLKSDHEPDAEYVDGVIEERPVGEYDHATWQYAIQQWFAQHGAAWNIRVRAELRVRVSPTRYRVPDVTVFDRGRPIEQILTHPPIAVFEVLSPEDRIGRMMVKLEDYALMGIRNIFVIDPPKEAIFAYKDRALVEITAGGSEQLAGSPGRIDWSKVREFLDN